MVLSLSCVAGFVASGRYATDEPIRFAIRLIW